MKFSDQRGSTKQILGLIEKRLLLQSLVSEVTREKLLFLHKLEPLKQQAMGSADQTKIGMIKKQADSLYRNYQKRLEKILAEAYKIHYENA